jgi:hypothetical protein
MLVSICPKPGPTCMNMQGASYNRYMMPELRSALSPDEHGQRGRAIWQSASHNRYEMPVARLGFPILEVPDPAELKMDNQSRRWPSCSVRVSHARLSVATGESHGRTQAIISPMIIWVVNANDCRNVTYGRALTQAPY